MKPINILYTQGPSGGGSMFSLVELLGALDRDRFNPIVLLRRRTAYDTMFESMGVDVHRLSDYVELPTPDEATRGLKSGPLVRLRSLARATAQCRIATPFFRWFLATHQIAIAHHNNSLSMDKVAVLGVATAGIPQICHFRNFTSVGPGQRLLARKVGAFVYISEAVRSHYERQGLAPTRGRLIYDPIDAVRYRSPVGATAVREEFGIERDAPLITNIGRMSGWKGQDYFVEAFAELATFFPSARALIVGGANSNWQTVRHCEKVKSLISSLGLQGRVILTGARDDIPRILGAADVVVHSASKPEPFGRVIVEAMMAGKPVIATAAGGVTDIIEPGRTGMLVPMRDAKAMAQAMVYLLEHPRDRERIAKAGCNEAVGRFSAERHAEQMQTLYGAVAQPRAALN